MGIGLIYLENAEKIPTKKFRILWKKPVLADDVCSRSLSILAEYEASLTIIVPVN